MEEWEGNRQNDERFRGWNKEIYKQREKQNKVAVPGTVRVEHSYEVSGKHSW
jgi:hypothetical protein